MIQLLAIMIYHINETIDFFDEIIDHIDEIISSFDESTILMKLLIVMIKLSTVLIDFLSNTSISHVDYYPHGSGYLSSWRLCYFPYLPCKAALWIFH